MTYFQKIAKSNQFCSLKTVTLNNKIIHFVWLFVFSFFIQNQVYAAIKDDQITPLQLTVTEQTWLLAHPNITVAFDGDFPPYSFINSKKQLDGIALDYFKLIEQKLNTRFKIAKNTVWEDIYSESIKENPTIDVIATMVDKPERHQWFKFTKPYIFKPLVVITKADSKLITRRKDLANKNIAIVKQYQYSTTILKQFPSITPYYVNTIKDALGAVASGKADGMIGYIGVVDWYRKKYFFKNLHIAALYEKDKANESIAVRKDWLILANILQKALNSISTQENNSIVQKWLPNISENKSYDKLFKQLATISFVALVLLLVVFYLRAQNKKVKQAEYLAKESNRKLLTLSNNLEEQVKQRTEKLFDLSYFDPLTKLANKNLLFKKMNKIILEYSENERTFAVLCLDINRFKYINDNLGYRIGDDVLKKLSSRLSEHLSNNDVIARYGGGEFYIILSDTTANQAIDVIRHLFIQIKQPYLLHNDPINLNFSMGVAMFPEDGMTTSTLLQRSNAAMYLAKEDKSNFVFSEPTLVQKYTDHLQLEQALLHAINTLSGESQNIPFQLYYQPIKWLNKKGLKGFEALIRWHHKELGSVSPERFISLAEEIGRVNEISHWVRLTAFKQARVWFEQGILFGRISVNLSPIELQNPHLINLLKEEITTCGSRFEWVEIEITETAILKNPKVAIEVLYEIKKLGARISIDDFGTGYSSLVYLKQIPADTVKIDREFIKNLPLDQEDLAIDKSIITLCHSLGKTIVAEGVENIEQLNLLQSIGCDSIQGYYISKAIPASQINKNCAFLGDISIDNEHVDLL